MLTYNHNLYHHFCEMWEAVTNGRAVYLITTHAQIGRGFFL